MSYISVIIPLYNTEEYIEDCLQSLKNQTYEKLEIIVINDGSTDGSKEAVENFMRDDDRIQLYNFNEQKGVGIARNYGVSKATGKYIYFLDSDDYLPRETLSILINNIGRNKIISGGYRRTYLSSAFTITFKGLFNAKNYTDNRYNLLFNFSANNYLISRKLIVKNKIQHSEDFQVYSDLYFMISLFQKVSFIPHIREAVYFRRLRNDPVLNPSLSQLDDVLLINSFLNVYLDLKNKYENDELIQGFLDKELLNYYRKEIITAYKFKENIDATYSLLVEAIKQVDQECVETADWILKKEIKQIKKGNLQKYSKLNSRHRFLREFKAGIKSKRKFYIFLYRNIFSKLPIKKDLIFFESFLGKNYSDSPKYIYEHMIDHNMKYKYVWSFDEQKNIPGKAKQVKRFSLKYFYTLARAKYWVSNSRLPRYLDKREENVYLQTWHGTPLKMLVFDMDEIYSADPNYKRNFYEQSRRWDYLSSPNEYSSDIFRRAFQYEKEMLEYGYPRNDILYTKNNADDINLLKKKMNIPTDKKVVLYAPTWRDDEFFSRGKYKFTLQLNLQKMQEELGDEYIILLRTHYFIANALDIEPYEGFAYDFSTYDDIAELYLVSDVLITDYSSVFFDYANLKRPILFFTYDLEKYRDKLRGFYLDIEKEVPGPLLRKSDDVLHALANIDDVEKEYREVYEQFYNRFCLWDDGKASQKTVEKVFE